MEDIKKIIKEHETFKQFDFFEKHIYGSDLKEFMGTLLNSVVINDRNFPLLGVEYISNTKTIRNYCIHTVKDIGVSGNYEDKQYKIINQQFIKNFKNIKLENNNLYITI